MSDAIANKVTIPYIVIDHKWNEIKNPRSVFASQMDSFATVIREIAKKVEVDHDSLVGYACSPGGYQATLEAIRNKAKSESDLSVIISESKEIFKLNLPAKVSGLTDSAIIVQLPPGALHFYLNRLCN